MPEPTALIFPNWQRELFKDHSRNRIFASTATADPVPPTVCGISSCGGHGRFLGRAHAINARRAKLASKSLKAPHGTGHTLAISDAALSTYFNLQDRLAVGTLVDVDFAAEEGVLFGHRHLLYMCIYAKR